MRKILTLAFMLFCMAAVAQNRPTFIVQAGYQGANLTDAIDVKMLHGFRAGVTVDYAFITLPTYELSLQTGLNYSMKGYWEETHITTVGKVKSTNRLHYLDLPVLINSRFKLSDTFNAFVNVGPYIAYGLSGKYTVETKKGDKKTDEGNLFKGSGDEKSKLHPFDFGAQVGVGVEMNRIMLGVGTQYGLAKLFRDSGRSAKNISFYASVGYRF